MPNPAIKRKWKRIYGSEKGPKAKKEEPQKVEAKEEDVVEVKEPVKEEKVLVKSVDLKAKEAIELLENGEELDLTDETRKTVLDAAGE